MLEHPLFRDTLKSKGLLKKYEDILNSKSGNLICYDDDDFLDYVLESDVLVGETTSLMAEYSIANKPIILVGDYGCLNEFGKTLIEPDNAVITFHELKKSSRSFAIIVKYLLKINDFSNLQTTVAAQIIYLNF